MNYALDLGCSWATTCQRTIHVGMEHDKAMTQHAAYKWHGHLFCEGDIVAVLTLVEPWSEWRDAGNDPATLDAESELDDIADMFAVNRKDDLQVAQDRFPQRLNELPEDFCVLCKQWFR